MKSLKYILLIFLLPSFSHADEVARKYLETNLQFFYVSNPNGTASINLDNAKIANGTITDIFSGNANMGKFQGILKALLMPVNKGGDDLMQTITYKICKLSTKPIVYYFFDDKTITLGPAAQNWSGCFTNNKFWPCAWNEKQHSSGKGLVSFGSFYVDQMTIEEFYGTFLHESTHTKDFSNARLENFLVGGRQYRYSWDQGHFFTEALPNFRSAYKEGIAYVMTLMYDQAFAKKYYEWYDKNDLVVVDTRQPSTTPAQNPGKSPDAWLYNALKAASAGNGTPIPGNPNYVGYKIRSLPGKFILHNELITGMILDSYNYLLGYNVFLNGLDNNNKVIGQDGNLGDLFNFMSKIGLPPGETFKTLNTSSKESLFLIPLAYADFFTSYTAKTAADFNGYFENKLDPDLLQIYWDNRFLFQVKIPAGKINSRNLLVDIATNAGLNRCTDLWSETGGR